MPAVDIDPQYEDFYFPASHLYTAGYNGPGRSNLMAYSAKQELILPSDYAKEIQRADESKATLDYAITYNKDQGQEGSCVGNGTTTACEVVSVFQFGIDAYAPMVGDFALDQIGESAQSGAVVMDALDAMIRNGCLPLDTPQNKARFEHTHPATGFKSRYPSGYQKTAKQFRIDECLRIDSFGAMVTALLRGHPVVVGREGHCIVYLRVINKNGALKFIYKNSWGDWGFGSGDMPNGFGADSERLAQVACRGAFAVCTMVVPEFYANAA